MNELLSLLYTSLLQVCHIFFWKHGKINQLADFCAKTSIIFFVRSKSWDFSQVLVDINKQ